MKAVVTLLLASLLASPALYPQGKGHGKGKGHSDTGSSNSGVRFTVAEARTIVDYYGPTTGHLPPGLAKRGGDLPPGLQKQLQRNGRLPPGLQKKLEPFPPRLAQRLPPPPPGCRRAVVGTWALLIQDTTDVVLDIVELVRR